MKVRDPVCDMCIEWEEACAFQEVGDDIVYFCCHGCAARFRAAPDDYLKQGGAPSDASHCPRRPRHDPVSSHGVPAAVPKTLLPVVGSLHVDAFEHRVHRAWAGQGVGRECRVLSRALLCRVLGWADPHRISVRIAAEISILRTQCDDLGAVLIQLTTLPDAVATACREAGLGGTEATRLRSAMAREVADVRLWLASYHSTLERQASNNSQER